MRTPAANSLIIVEKIFSVWLAQIRDAGDGLMYCRYALMKTIEECYRFKDDAERYEKISKSYRQDIDILLRGFKLCQLCFFGSGPMDWKGNKSKFVKGVYDRGITTDYDLGWVCAKCKADEVRLNKKVGPILSKMFMKQSKMDAREKEKTE